MHIRERNRRVECVRIQYDPAIKRGRNILVGSFNRFTLVVPDELREKLTPAEQQQLAGWVEARQQAKRDDSLDFNARYLPLAMGNAGKWFESAADKEEAAQRAEAIWAAWSELKRAMRKQGLLRPKSAD